MKSIRLVEILNLQRPAGSSEEPGGKSFEVRKFGSSEVQGSAVLSFAFSDFRFPTSVFRFLDFRFLVLGSWLMVLFPRINAQTDTPQAPPLVHEKTVYRDNVSQKLFWPMDKPFYVWLSALPDENAPAFLLNQMVINETTSETEPLTNGIRLEISGSQFVRWINAVTSKETRLKFYADGEPPAISDSLSDAPLYSANKTQFYGKGLKCTIKSKDMLSGVKATYYSIDGASFGLYSAPLSLSTEKTYNVRYYSVDNTGYANEPNVIAFTVDLSAPVTDHKNVENFSENTLSSKTKIELTSTDNLSGVDDIFYKFDGSEKFSTYRYQLPVSQLKNGEHTITYYAVDHVKNEEKEKTYSFYLDKEPPKTEVSVRGEQHEKNGKILISTHSLLQFAATDDKIGVDHIYYAINNSSDFLTYENPFPLSMKSGQFSVSYYAKDKLGNTSDILKKNYFMDVMPPKTDNKIEGPYYAQRSTVWLTRETKIALMANDDESGVRKTNYIISEEQPKDYTGQPISLSKDGNYLFRYFSYDNVGNREGDNVLLLIVDNAPPDIKEIFSVSPVDSTMEKDSRLNVYPQYTTLFLAATDMSSGIQGVWYAINGKPMQEYFSSILCDKIGRYEIKVRAKDNLSHVAEKILRFYIKKLDDRL